MSQDTRKALETAFNTLCEGMEMLGNSIDMLKNERLMFDTTETLLRRRFGVLPDMLKARLHELNTIKHK